jgi:histidine ammonia-lyase
MVLENVTTIVAIELMAAAQAIDFRLFKEPTLQQGAGTSLAMRSIREIVPFFEKDAFLQPYLLRLVDAVSKSVFCELA